MHEYRKIIHTFIFLALLAGDQYSKYIIRSTGGFYICNKNAAFSLAVPDILFWFFWIGIIFFLLLSLYKKLLRQNVLYAILILAGAIANIIDRLYFGCVIDFINLKFWPMFNLADVYITIGAIILIIKHITHSMKHKA